MQSVDKETVQH